MFASIFHTQFVNKWHVWFVGICVDGSANYSSQVLHVAYLPISGSYGYCDYSWHGTTPGPLRSRAESWRLLLARDYSWPVTPEAGGRNPSAVDKSAMRRFASLCGEVLLYRHQRIATMTKVYIASNSIHVEIIRFHTIIETLVTFETRQQRALLLLLLLWMLSVQNWTHSAQQSRIELIRSIAPAFRYMPVPLLKPRYKRQVGSNSLLFTAFKTVYLDSR